MRVALAVLAVLPLAACSAPSGEDRPNDTDRPSASAPAEESVGRPVLAAAQVRLSIKTVEKDCFGSAGCSIEYRVKAGWPKSAVADGDRYEVTYRVTGPEDGPQIGTLTINDDGTFTGGDESALTPKSSTELKVAVTEVEQVG